MINKNTINKILEQCGCKEIEIINEPIPTGDKLVNGEYWATFEPSKEIKVNMVFTDKDKFNKLLNKLAE